MQCNVNILTSSQFSSTQSNYRVSQKNAPNLWKCSVIKHGPILMIFSTHNQNTLVSSVQIMTSLCVHFYSFNLPPKGSVENDAINTPLCSVFVNDARYKKTQGHERQTHIARYKKTQGDDRQTHIASYKKTQGNERQTHIACCGRWVWRCEVGHWVQRC